MSIWLRGSGGATRACARDELSAIFFHSSAPAQWRGRTKPAFGLAQDLTPASPSGSIHVAPKESKHRRKKEPPAPAFTRDPLPHADVTESAPQPSEGKNPSFRRRSRARDEQDWNRRTGKWRTLGEPSPGHWGPQGSLPLSRESKFGGGNDKGSRMGLREDRPSAYGLDPRDSPETRNHSYEHLSLSYQSSSRPQHHKSEAGFPSFPRHPRRAFELQPPSGALREIRAPLTPSPPADDGPSLRRSPPSAFVRNPVASSSSGLARWTSFGLLPSSSLADREDDRQQAESSNTIKSSPFARRRPPSNTFREHAGSLPRSSSDELDQAKTDPSLEGSDLDEADTLLPPKPLKNRNQPKAPAPPPTPKLKVEASSPPKKYLPEISPFYHPPPNLTRAGVPIVTKSDPATATTTSSYSAATPLRDGLPAKFSSPPLLPGLLKCLTDVIGSTAVPTPVQALSLKWVVDAWYVGRENVPTPTDTQLDPKASADSPSSEQNYKEFLLASETGSGKSIAYLLPVLQALKISEVRRTAEEAKPITSKRGLNPRAVILAPTHELARQLSGFAKALLHEVKLRVLCASRSNEPSRMAKDKVPGGKGRKTSSASRMKALLSFADDGQLGEFQVKETELSGSTFPVDIVVGTPMKLMEMVRGRGWERSVEFGGGVAATLEMKKREQQRADNTDVGEETADGHENGPKRRRGRDSLPGVGKWRSSPEMGLSEVEWVVVDEADVLFDSDFQETTRMLLADIAKARGRAVPFTPLPVGLLAPAPPTPVPEPRTSRQTEKEKKAKEKEQVQTKSVAVRSTITPLNYPFNFLLTSATIPNSLSSYLNAYHPRLKRLLSPNVHHLPKNLKTEYVSWTGGNKNADIERRLRKVWAADAADGLGPVPDSLGDMSKVLIFCNKNTKVNDLGEFLDEKGIKNIQLSGSSETRKRGNNKHLSGFLKTPESAVNAKPDDWSSSWVADEKEEGEEDKAETVQKKASRRSLKPITKNEPAAEEPINDPMNVPHVMITTSLLSRGLDFSPNIKHVFIIDEPRNMVDFLHRAGRTGRAGENGKVVLFGKMEGRGSQRTKDVQKRVKALLA
ncbi:P-loop containing nucleoside triphosphate hydrolase protein [Mycena sp. CBHHK59/15]|nr:P-loop containing nucleoside triphosphate hydrolase protein [Mycena sp. CBHHK59/15]